MNLRRCVLHPGLFILLSWSGCPPPDVCNDPEASKTAPYCQPDIKHPSLPGRISLSDVLKTGWAQDVALAKVRSWHRFRLDLLTPDRANDAAADPPCGDSGESNLSASDEIKTYPIPVYVDEQVTLGPARWVLRNCGTGERIEAMARVYDPPSFAARQNVTDKSLASPRLVKEYTGVGLSPGYIHAHELIDDSGNTRHRLSVLGEDGTTKVTNRVPEFFEESTDWKSASTQQAGLFANFSSKLLYVRAFNDPATRHDLMLPANSSLLVGDPAGSRVAVVVDKQLHLYQVQPSTMTASTLLGMCDLPDAVDALAVAQGHSGPLTEIPLSTVTSTVVALGKRSGNPVVTVCYEHQIQTGDKTTTALRANPTVAACFASGVMAAQASSMQLALSDLDGDGLLDLLIVPADKTKPLHYVPAIEGASGCHSEPLQGLTQPAEPISGVAAGLFTSTTFTRRMTRPIPLPDVAFSTQSTTSMPSSLVLFKRKALTPPQ